MKNSFRLLAFLSVLLMMSVACSLTRNSQVPNPQSDQDDQKISVSEIRQLDTFSKIEMEGGAKVMLVQGDEYSIKVEGTKRIVDQVTTEVKDGVLMIDYRDKKLIKLWIDSPTLTITFPDLSSFRLDGGAELKADGLKLDILNFKINGGANVRMNDLAVNTLNMTVDGGSDVHVSGAAENLSIDIMGGTNFESEDFECANVNVEVDGAANVVVWATQTLKLDLAGAYSVSYWGSPVITQSIGGIGQVKALGNK